MRIARRVALVAALTVSLLAAPAAAQQLARLFPEEADVYVSDPGVVRLPLPPEVVAATSPDLADLRLFDRAGREVPYLVDPGVPSGTTRRERLTVDAQVSDLAREEVPRDDARALTREVYRVALPDGARDASGWSLVADAAATRYVRRVEVRGVSADGSEVVLVPRASLVRLGQAHVDRDRIPLPRFVGREIVLVIEGEEGFFLEPELRFERDRVIGAAGATEVPLELLLERHEEGRTVLELGRPPSLAAARLRFASTTPAFDREVVVYDVLGAGAPQRIGGGRVTRAPLADALVPDQQLEVPVAAVRGDRLRVEIADGDSPPLAEVAVAAVFSPPALLFAMAPAADGAPAGVLRFGGRRAHEPHYDLADLFRDAVAASAELLADPSRIPLARLGPVRPNPTFDAAPALAAVMQPGPVLDVDAWRWRRALEVPSSPEGLARLRLEPEDLAAARDDRGDLRVVDASGRQWPYVVAPATERGDVALHVEGPTTKDGRSTWRLALPVESLRVDGLRIETARPVLSRTYRLRARDAGGLERPLAEGTLAQALRRPGPLRIGFPATRVASLELEVEDGDDAPIEILRAVAPVALPSLLVAVPEGSYALLAGNPDAERPAYEIDRAREVVLELRSVPVMPGAGVENERWTGTPGGAARQRQRLQQVAIWSAIALAVLVLGLLTLRMARRPG